MYSTIFMVYWMFLQHFTIYSGLLLQESNVVKGVYEVKVYMGMYLQISNKELNIRY